MFSFDPQAQRLCTPSQCQEIEVLSAEQQDNEPATVVQPNRPNKGVRFAMDSSSESKWTDSPKSAPTKSRSPSINDFCDVLRQTWGLREHLGCLISEENQGPRFDLYHRSTILERKLAYQSLGELLVASTESSPTRVFTRRDRLQVAVTLASSVLELSGTPWLSPFWTSSDIYFRGDGSELTAARLSYPYLPWRNCIFQEVTVSSTISRSDIKISNRNEVIVALGLILVELCFGNTLLGMRMPEDDASDEWGVRMNTAYRLLDSVYDEMGGDYGDAVRRCLHQPFDERDMSLENGRIQEQVFDDIFTPLAEDLRNFEGKSRIK